MRTIPIYNGKGGVSKTATAVNLGHALVRLGYRVLVIDWCRQANCSTHIGRSDRDPRLPVAGDVFLKPSLTTEAIGPSVVDGLDLLYGSPGRYFEDEGRLQPSLADAEKEIVAQQHPAPGMILKRILKRIEPLGYDYVLVDCTNGDGYVAKNAIIAAEELLVPIQTEYAAMEGLGLVRKLIRELETEESIETQPRLLAFAALVDERVGSSKTLRDVVAELPGVHALKTVVHRNAPVADCYGAKLSIFDYNASARGAAEYDALAAEIDGLYAHA